MAEAKGGWRIHPARIIQGPPPEEKQEPEPVRNPAPVPKREQPEQEPLEREVRQAGR